jgi:hypothetical protein
MTLSHLTAAALPMKRLAFKLLLLRQDDSKVMIETEDRYRLNSDFKRRFHRKRKFFPTNNQSQPNNIIIKKLFARSTEVIKAVGTFTYFFAFKSQRKKMREREKANDLRPSDFYLHFSCFL